MYNQFQQYQNQSYPYNWNRQEVIKVNGEEGAKAYQLPPNSSVLLLDESAPIVWLKTTDGASYPTIKGYTITPIEVKEEKDLSNSYNSLESRVSALERILSGNGKSDTQ